MVLAVKGAVASPPAVGIVMVLEPLENLPEAPVAGAVKTTLIPFCGSPRAPVTSTTRGSVKALPVWAA